MIGVALVALAALLPQGGSADSMPPRPIRQLVHTIWTPKYGGGPSGVRALAQTTDGYIWVGTFFGLLRFDGVQFVKYKSLAGDSIPTGTINRLLATRDGTLWIVGRGGSAIRLRENRARLWGIKDSLPQVMMLAASSTGEVVAGTASGPYRLAGDKWEAAGAAWGFPGKECRAAWYDRDDNLWAVTEDRVVYLPKGEHRFLDPGFPLSNPSLATHFAQERDGTIWMSELNGSAYTIRKVGESAASYTQVQVDPLALLIDRKGSLWISGSGGGLRRVPDVARIRGKRVGEHGVEAEEFTMKDGLLTDISPALLEDHEGNIWVGSSSGLERFREGAFTPWLAAAPGRPRFVQAGADSSVWTGPYNNTTLQRFGPRGQDSINSVSNAVVIAQDSSGRISVINGSRIFRREGARFVPLPMRPPKTHGLFSLTIDPAGTIWTFSSQLGLMRLDGDTLIEVARLEEPVYHVGLPWSDSKGRIWVAQRGRVALYDHGTLTTYEADHGIAGMVYWFFEDTVGTIWAPTGRGLSRFQGDRFRTLGASAGIPGGSVFGAVEDNDGAWWLATTPGILRFPPGEIDRMLADSAYRPHFRTFDESDGMVGALVKSYFGPMLAKSGDGKVWAVTDSGLASIDPRRLPLAVPPPITLEVARIRGVEQAISDTTPIPAGTNDLEIDYTSLTFGTPERTQFRYQLEGEDQTWREVGTRRRAYYTGLRPGWYTFRVTSSFGDGVWNENVASWRFRVLPSWYQTLWFRALIVLLIGGLGAAVAALIQRQRHQAVARQFEATLAERARIAQELHDTLLQGMAGVSMQLKAAERALPDRPDIATETLIHVQQLTRETLREARERVLDLHEPDLGNEDVAGALEASGRGLVAASDVAFSLLAQGDRRRLPRAIEFTALRIGREAIANAVKHATATSIQCVVRFEDAALQLEVRDNGRGFTAEQGEQARQQGHLGLRAMHNRAEQAGGSCTITSSPTEGTVIVVLLPVNQMTRL